jgi:hypothetical protein
MAVTPPTSSLTSAGNRLIYLDSSALVKLVHPEPETAALLSWLGQRPPPRCLIRTGRRRSDASVAAQRSRRLASGPAGSGPAHSGAARPTNSRYGGRAVRSAAEDSRRSACRHRIASRDCPGLRDLRRAPGDGRYQRGSRGQLPRVARAGRRSSWRQQRRRSAPACPHRTVTADAVTHW